MLEQETAYEVVVTPVKGGKSNALRSFKHKLQKTVNVVVVIKDILYIDSIRVLLRGKSLKKITYTFSEKNKQKNKKNQEKVKYH